MKGVVLNLLAIFVINVFSNCLKTLKTIFVSKNLDRPFYLITFIEAILFTLIFKTLSAKNSLVLIIVFALGKVVGAYLGNIIDRKIALGILEITIYAKIDKGIKIADTLRSLGYSVTTFMGYGKEGYKRCVISIQIARKEYTVLTHILKKYGYNEATTIIKEIKETTGKISVNAKVQNG